MKKRSLVFILCLFIGFTIYAQKRVTGVVYDTQNNPVPGVTIMEKGTTNGVISDVNGNFSIEVASEASVLAFSFVGMESHELVVGTQTNISVTMKDMVSDLEEVVVIGYGVQKKKLTTGATVQVKGEDLQKLNTVSALGALQSQSPGVNITQSSGQPGEGFKVTIRGLGTIGNSSPLYVIDGVAGGDINNLNPADIESIDVLKDAASAAIYGARAANGVILVSTKKGKSGKVSLSYDGYYGQQYIYKMPPLLNAKEYMTIMDEVRFNSGTAGYNWANILPEDLYNSIQDGSWNGTNWIKESYNEGAPTQNHSINLTGGSDYSTFSLGFSYTGQEGILGVPTQSNYDRYTLRINSDHVVLKAKDFDALTIGQTLNYAYSERSGIATGNLYWNSVHDLLITTPLLPAYDSEGNLYDYYDKTDNGWLFDGNTANPIANYALSTRGRNLSKNHNLQTSAYIQIQPIKNLIFKSQYGFKMSANTYRSYDMIRRLSNNTNITTETANQNGGAGFSWTLDNTLSYRLALDAHLIDVVAGQSVERWGLGEGISSSGQNTIFLGSWKNAYVDNTNPTSITQMSAGGSPWGRGALASFFGRLNYNYNETYMASVTLRADGSSNFDRGNRWGYFPSVSAGWVLSNESFMEGTASWMNFLKIRGSWGQNGNCNIDGFQYLTTFAFDDKNVYYFGSDKTTQTIGGYADILKNPDITWETSEQINFGLDARFLGSRLGLAFDYYVKTTNDWLVRAPILGTFGLGAPYINGGDVENKGYEIALSWNDRAGDLNYGVNLNIASNKNEVLRIANAEGIIHGDANVLSQGTTEMYRAQEGYPIGYFYGYKTAGVFQNWEQITNTPVKYSTAQPGDLIFVDNNKDGSITEEDRTMIGNPHPDLTLGLAMNFGYKGFDLSVTTYGAFGHQIAKSYRSFADSPIQNYTTDIFGRWHGEGTSNKLPRLTPGSHSNWQNISDIYIEDADFLKIQNLTLGYDFKKLFPAMPLGQARIYVQAQNLYTFTGYSGMDPEIGYGYDKSWVSGIDLGFYPAPRTYLIGINLKF